MDDTSLQERLKRHKQDEKEAADFREAELLDLFRKLSEDGKQDAIAYLKTILGILE